MQIQPITTASPALPVQRSSDATVTVATATTTVHLLNPKPAIDPGLGIVVTEYFNKAGQMTEQYPTARALDNYRIYGLPDAGSTRKADAAQTEAGTATPTADRAS